MVHRMATHRPVHGGPSETSSETGTAMGRSSCGSNTRYLNTYPTLAAPGDGGLAVAPWLGNWRLGQRRDAADLAIYPRDGIPESRGIDYAPPAVEARSCAPCPCVQFGSVGMSQATGGGLGKGEQAGLSFGQHAARSRSCALSGAWAAESSRAGSAEAAQRASACVHDGQGHRAIPEYRDRARVRRDNRGDSSPVGPNYARVGSMAWTVAGSAWVVGRMRSRGTDRDRRYGWGRGVPRLVGTHR